MCRLLAVPEAGAVDEENLLSHADLEWLYWLQGLQCLMNWVSVEVANFGQLFPLLGPI